MHQLCVVCSLQRMPSISLSVSPRCYSAGPNTHPWGTPLIIGLHVTIKPLMATLWVWPSSQFPTHWVVPDGSPLLQSQWTLSTILGSASTSAILSMTVLFHKEVWSRCSKSWNQNWVIILKTWTTSIAFLEFETSRVHCKTELFPQGFMFISSDPRLTIDYNLVYYVS